MEVFADVSMKRDDIRVANFSASAVDTCLENSCRFLEMTIRKENVVLGEDRELHLIDFVPYEDLHYRTGDVCLELAVPPW